MLLARRMQRARPFAVGDEVRLRELRVEITAITRDGRPAEILAHLDAPLEDPRYRFLAWKQSQVGAFTPPAVGERVVLPAIDCVALLPPYPGGGKRFPHGVTR
jgi:hypothetical protein